MYIGRFNRSVGAFPRAVLAGTAFAILCLAAQVRAGATGSIAVSDLNGASVRPLSMGSNRATVLIFITNDCPIANACAPEIERIYRDYKPKKIRTFLVYVDPELSGTAARAHSKAYRYTCPALLDPEHKLVKLGHARVTPEAAVFDQGGHLIYHGRLDDRAVAFGQVRAQPIKRDLRIALDALLQGKPIPQPKNKAIGCSISDLENKH